ncbi:MAG: hypothetical protein KA339_07115 [Candidatus Kapabacteria bacterium]|nr:hypothetical protein [Ignavibacteria bacterium]MBP6510312.1 hypothetical protein [Candidatus Kapabacteria bacterium]MBK6419649.1 hypothetical protein [Ignavibacteria bacterium]MBK6759721.1 hypothetical protein [Ignavibacteria bacterium]MBK7413412.1 hypothetical protein [Ignavibacteria bacterium]
MKKFLKFLSVVATIIVATTFSVSAQWFVGPAFTYSISTGLGEDVTAYGAPTRFNLGVRANKALASTSELYLGLNYRVENGGFMSAFVATPAMRVGKLDVVEPDPGAPKVTSTINTSAIELDFGISFKITDLDTSGSRLMLNVGALVDNIFSADQTDDYSAIPANELGERPKTVSAEYASQFGFGAQLGVSLILPVGDGRAIFDVGYMVRQPTEFDIPNATSTTASTQDVGWLIGRGFRLGLAYQFGF